MRKGTSIVQAARAGFLEVATQGCLVLDVRHLVLIVSLFERVLFLILLLGLRPLIPTFVLIIAVPRAIAIIIIGDGPTTTIVGSVVAAGSAVLLWVALGLGVPLVIVVSLLTILAVTRTVFSHTLAPSAVAFRLAIVVDAAITVQVVTVTMPLLLILLVII